MYAQYSTQATGTLVNRAQAKTGALRQLRATAIVTNKQTQTLPLIMQAHAHLTSLCVPGYIGQGLLHQAVQMGLGRQWQTWQSAAERNLALHPLCGLPVVAEQLQRLIQLKTLQHHRVKIADQCAKAFLQALAVHIEVLGGGAYLFGLIRLGLLQAGLGANATEVLAKIVVQGLPQTCAFAFL